MENRLVIHQTTTAVIIYASFDHFVVEIGGRSSYCSSQRVNVCLPRADPFVRELPGFGNGGSHAGECSRLGPPASPATPWEA